MAGIPDWLGPHGQAKWLEISKALSGIPDDLLDQVGFYCEAYDDFRSALVTIAEEGSECVSDKGGTYQHPAVGRKNKAITRMRQFGPLIGWREGKGPVAPATKKVAARPRR